MAQDVEEKQKIHDCVEYLEANIYDMYFDVISNYKALDHLLERFKGDLSQDELELVKIAHKSSQHIVSGVSSIFNKFLSQRIKSK